MSLAGCDGPWDTDPVPSLSCNMRAAEAAAPFLGLLSPRNRRAFPVLLLFDALTKLNNLFLFAWSHVLGTFLPCPLSHSHPKRYLI